MAPMINFPINLLLLAAFTVLLLFQIYLMSMVVLVFHHG